MERAIDLGMDAARPEQIAQSLLGAGAGVAEIQHIEVEQRSENGRERNPDESARPMVTEPPRDKSIEPSSTVIAADVRRPPAISPISIRFPRP
jgi:hypothetical protein